jgi:hypothetical protein
MSGRIDSHGDIEVLLHSDSAVGIGERVLLVFRPIDEPEPPIGITIQSPQGQKIVDRVLRELPTGRPQSAPPVEFIPSIRGTYAIEVKELRGKQRGSATLKVT